MIAEQEADVTVDFTVAAVAVENALWCAAHRINAVVGTTGVDADSMARVAQAFPSDGSLGCMVVPGPGNSGDHALVPQPFATRAARRPALRNDGVRKLGRVGIP